MNKLLESLQQDKKKMLLVVLIFVILIYIDYSFILSTQLNLLKGLDIKITQLKLDITSLKQQLSQLQQKQNKQLASDAKSPAKKIISEGEIAGLLQQISTLANKNNVKIIQIKPASEAAPNSGEKKSGNISAVAISLDLICSYHALGAFVNSLENAKEFISVEEAKITRHGTNETMGENVNLELKAYVSK